MNENNFVIEFNIAVENISAIVREARHMHIAPSVYQYVGMVENMLHDINFKMFFVEDDEDYVYSNVLTIMDSLLDALEEAIPEGTNEYKVVNSVYDVLNEFYFEEYFEE